MNAACRKVGGIFSKRRNKVADENPTGSYVVFFDALVDTVTGEEEPAGTFSEESIAKMFNSAPSEELKKKRGPSTHVVHTKMGYDIFFHIGVG